MASVEQSKRVHEPEEIASVILALAAAQAKVQITLSRRGAKLEGRIVNFDRRNILCSMSLAVGAGNLRKTIPCLVDCSTPSFKCQFASTIAGYEHSEIIRGELNIRLAVPTELSREQNRDIFRVPCTPGCGLTIKVMIDNQIFLPDPLDASFAGLRLGFTGDDDPKMNVGQEVDMTTSFCGWYRLDFKAVVQWVDKGVYGVVIPQFLLDGEFHPPSQWVEVLHGLQVKWSQARRDVA